MLLRHLKFSEKDTTPTTKDSSLFIFKEKHVPRISGELTSKTIIQSTPTKLTEQKI